MTCGTCAGTLELSPLLRGWLTCTRCERDVVDQAAAEIDLRIRTAEAESVFTLELTPAFRAAYRLEALLGMGGMGAVFRAVQLSVNRPVALKVLTDLSDRRLLMRFHREARMLAQLDHPNVVRVFDVGTVGECPYLAMEWVRGGSLRDKMPEGTRLDFDVAIALFLPILAGLEYCHGRKVLHRDIKPENVLIGEDGAPRIADFGLATCRDYSTRITAAETFMGTPYYVAPEVAAGEEARPASDVYAVGVMLFEALCGRHPFQGSVVEVINQHLSQPAPRLLALRPASPVGLDRILTRCLTKNPADRYARASALAYDLQKVDLTDIAPALDRVTAPIPVLDPHAAEGSNTAILRQPAAGDRSGRRRRGPSSIGPERIAAQSRAPRTADARTSARLAGSALLGLALAAGLAAALFMTRRDAPASNVVTQPTPAPSTASNADTEPPPAPERAGSTGYGSRLWVEPQAVTADISRDGQWMVTRSGVRDLTRLWRARTGRLVAEVGADSDPAGALRFSPAGDAFGILQVSGKLVVYRTGDKPGDGQVVAQALPGTLSTRTAMALECAPDDHWLGAVLDSGSVWVVGTPPLATRRLLPAVKGGPRARVEVDASRRRVLCVDTDAVVREWDALTGALEREESLPGLDPQTAWAWHGPTRRFAYPVSGSGKIWQQVHLLRLGSGDPHVLFMPADGSLGSVVNTLRFSADGEWLLLGCTSYAFNDRLEWWNVTGKEPVRHDMHMGYRALDFVRVSTDGRHAIGLYRARKVLVASRGGPEPIEQLAFDVGHEGPVTGLALETTAAGLAVVTAGYDLKLRVWDPATRRARPPAITYSQHTTSVRRCPCGERLIVTELQGGVKAVPFDERTKFLISNRAFQVLEVQGGGTPCTHRLLALDRDGAVSQVEPGKPPVPVAAPGGQLVVPDVTAPGAIPGHVVRKPGGSAWLAEIALRGNGVYTDPPTGLGRRMIMPQNEWLSASAVWLLEPPRKPVKVCGPESGQLVGMGFGPAEGEIQAVVLPPAALGVSVTPRRRVVNATTGAVVREETLPRMPSPPTAGALSPDGRILLVGGMDRELRVLTAGAAPQWKSVAALNARAAQIAFDSTSSAVAVGTWDGSLATWPIRELCGF